MRSNAYYSKKYITGVVLASMVFYCLFTAVSAFAVKDASAFNISDFTPNYNKNFKEVLLLDTTPEDVIGTVDMGEFILSNINYDMSTLYLDWSEIEAERTRLAAEEEKRLAELAEANKTKPTTGTSLVSATGSLSLPNIADTSFKGYMCMHTITSKSSMQWKFLRSGDFELHTDSNGIMMYKNYYIVAMASYYTNYKVGSTFRITLDSGTVFDVITGDEKADIHTDNTHTYRPKGSGRGEIVEFVIACGKEGKVCNDYNTMTPYNRNLGNLSSLGFKGNVVKIEKLDDYEVSNYLYG